MTTEQSDSTRRNIEVATALGFFFIGFSRLDYRLSEAILYLGGDALFEPQTPRLDIVLDHAARQRPAGRIFGGLRIGDDPADDNLHAAR